MFEQFSLWSMKITRPCIYPTLKEIAIIPVQNSFVQIGMKARGIAKHGFANVFSKNPGSYQLPVPNHGFESKVTLSGFQHREWSPHGGKGRLNIRRVRAESHLVRNIWFIRFHDGGIYEVPG
jgi:hypothetical protein